MTTHDNIGICDIKTSSNLTTRFCFSLKITIHTLNFCFELATAFGSNAQVVDLLIISMEPSFAIVYQI